MGAVRVAMIFGGVDMERTVGDAVGVAAGVAMVPTMACQVVPADPMPLVGFREDAMICHWWYHGNATS